MINTNVEGTDAAIYGILDGHGGEFAAVFAKEHLIGKLSQKIEDAINIATGKTEVTPIRSTSNADTATEERYSVEKDDEKTNVDDVLKSPQLTDKRNRLKKTMSTDVDCNQRGNCSQEQDAFLNRIGSIRLTRESFLNASKISAKPTEYDANYYVEKDRKINFGKMITDLVLLTDYELIEKAKKQVRNSIYSQ